MTLAFVNYFTFRLIPGIILLPEKDASKCSMMHVVTYMKFRRISSSIYFKYQSVYQSTTHMHGLLSLAPKSALCAARAQE